MLKHKKDTNTVSVPWGPFVDGLLSTYLVIVVVTVFFLLSIIDSLTQNTSKQVESIFNTITSQLQQRTGLDFKLLPSQKPPIILKPYTLPSGQDSPNSTMAFSLNNIGGDLPDNTFQTLLTAVQTVAQKHKGVNIRIQYPQQTAEELGYSMVLVFVYDVLMKLEKNINGLSHKIEQQPKQQGNQSHDMVIILEGKKHAK